MSDALDRPTDLDRLCGAVEVLGRETLARIREGRFDDSASELDPDEAVRVVDLTGAARLLLADAGPGEVAVLFVDETRRGPVADRLREGAEGWHGYARAIAPARYAAVVFTGGRPIEDLLAGAGGLEALHRHLAHAVDLLTCPSGRAGEIDQTAEDPEGRACQRAALIGRALAHKTLRLRADGPAPEADTAGAERLAERVLGASWRSDPETLARAGRLMRRHALAA